MEYCAGGEFYQTLSRQATRILPETWAKFYASEVLLAIEYLHSEKFIYRDLKPENILVHHSGHLRLADFDLSTKVQMTRKKSWFGLTSNNLPLAQPQMVGTEEYVAPEVVANQEQTFAIDWWSFGILLYEMLYGTTPFCADTTQETFALIGRGKVKFSEKQAVSKTCKDLIKKLLHTDPKKRLGANGAGEVKAHPFFSGVSWTNINKQTPPIKVYIKDMFDTSYFWSVEDRNETESDEPVEPFVIGEDNCFKGFCYSSPRSLEYSKLVE
jgi:protein-serine/threonine kinase